MKKSREGGAYPGLHIQRFQVVPLGSPAEALTPGQIPGMTLPPEVYAVPTGPGPNYHPDDDRPVLTVEKVARDILPEDEARAFTDFLRGLGPDNEAQLAMRVREFARERGYPAEQARALLRRSASYYKTTGKLRPTAGIRARAARGLKRDEGMEKAEPRGGKYHARITNPDGSRRYVYDPEAYRRRPDAHIRGDEILRDRLRKDVTDGIGDGCDVEELRAKVRDPNGLDDMLKELAGSGVIRLEGSRVLPPSVDPMEKGPPRLTVKMQPAAGDAPVPKVPAQQRSRERAQQTQILKEAGMAKSAPQLLVKADKDGDRSGEGTRGGHVVGHTKSGKAIYEINHPSPLHQGMGRDNSSMYRMLTKDHHPNFTADDHVEAFQHFQRKQVDAQKRHDEAKDPESQSAALKDMRNFAGQAHGHNLRHESLSGERADTRLMREHNAREFADNQARREKMKTDMSGKQLGTTQSGKPIMGHSSHEAHKDFTEQDHRDAARIHREKRPLASFGGPTQDNSGEQRQYHHDQSEAHEGHAQVKGIEERKQAAAKEEADKKAKRAAKKVPPAAGSVRVALGTKSFQDVPAHHSVGNWHVHDSTQKGGKKYTVSHGPSGMAVHYTGSKREAMKLAEHLHKEVPEALKNAKTGQPLANGGSAEDMAKIGHAVQAHRNTTDQPAMRGEALAALRGGKSVKAPGHADHSDEFGQGFIDSHRGWEDVDHLNAAGILKEHAAKMKGEGGPTHDAKRAYESMAEAHLASAGHKQLSAHGKGTGPLSKLPPAAKEHLDSADDSIREHARTAASRASMHHSSDYRKSQVTADTKPMREWMSKAGFVEPDVDAMREAREEAQEDAGGEQPDPDDAPEKPESLGGDDAVEKAFGTSSPSGGGEGSRGGHVIGHTGSGKAIYASGSYLSDWSHQDHRDAGTAHTKAAAAARAAGKTDEAGEHEKAVARHAAVGAKMSKADLGLMADWMSKAGIPGATEETSDGTSGSKVLENTRSGKGSGDGIPGAEDEGGGKDPAGALPSSAPDIDQGKGVNGQLSMPGMEGGDVGQGKTEGMSKAIPGASEDGMDGTSGSKVQESTRPGTGKQEGIPGASGEGKTEKLSPDDGPGDAMPSGEPGVVEEKYAGLAGSPDMDTGSMTKEQMGKSLLNTYSRVPEDQREAFAKAILDRVAQTPDLVQVPAGGPPRQVAAPKDVGAFEKSYGFVHYSDRSDREADEFMKSEQGGGSESGPPVLDVRGAIYKSELCKACKSNVPAYLAKCDHCGSSMNKAQGASEQLQKSQQPAVRIVDHAPIIIPPTTPMVRVTE